MTKDRTSSDARADSGGASTLDLSGRHVGSSYILKRPIGQGATGTVWQGDDLSTGEPVAIKLLHESLLQQPKLVTRFVQERTILLMLRHRNVVRVRDLFSVGATLGLVMDLVSGGSLRDHLRKHGSVAPGEAARLAAQVAAALAEAHDLGVVHRDLKPDNILLQAIDGRLETRLTDFGVARILNTPSLTTPNAIVGTPHYMSPEAFHGATASPTADVYALGVLLYELLSGRLPYDSDSIPELMRLHLEGNPQRPPAIPDALWDVITSCMELKPRLRPTAPELLGDLSDIARQLATAAPGDLAPVESPAPRPDRSSSAVPPDLRWPPDPPGQPASAAAAGQPVPRQRTIQPTRRWAHPGVLALVALLVAGIATAVSWRFGHAPGDPGAVVAVRAPVHPAVASSPAYREPSRTTSPAVTRQQPAGAAVMVDLTPDPTRARSVPTVPTESGVRSPEPESHPYGRWQCTRRNTFGGRILVRTRPCQRTGRDNR